MREILFRGKRVDNGEWVEGCGFADEGYFGKIFFYHDTFTDEEGAEHLFYDNIRVHTDTVSQYTSLQDKNGKKIFERDIVLAPLWKGRRLELTKGLIEFSKGAFSAVWQDTMYGKHFAGYVADMEVIGNIFDNPELWEENQ